MGLYLPVYSHKTYFLAVLPLVLILFLVLNRQLYIKCSCLRPFLFRHGLGLEMPVPSQGHYGFHSFPVVD